MPQEAIGAERRANVITYITHLLIGEMLSPTRNKVNVQKTLNAMKGKIMGRSDMKKIY